MKKKKVKFGVYACNIWTAKIELLGIFTDYDEACRYAHMCDHEMNDDGTTYQFTVEEL